MYFVEQGSMASLSSGSSAGSAGSPSLPVSLDDVPLPFWMLSSVTQNEVPQKLKVLATWTYFTE